MTNEEQRAARALHGAGEHVEINMAVALAGAWWTVAEVMRRHPDEVQLFETVPIAGGMYLCLALYQSRDEIPYTGTVVHLNLAGSASHIASHDENPLHINWAEVVLAPDRRNQVIKPIEQALYLDSPDRTPPTERSTIAYRVFASFMARAAFAGRTASSGATRLEEAHWRFTQGFYEGRFQPKLYEAFRDLPNPPEPQYTEHGESFYDWDDLPSWYADHWFLVESDQPHVDTPRVAIDARNGKAWSPDAEHDLMTLFERNGRSVDRVTTAAMPPTC